MATKEGVATLAQALLGFQSEAPALQRDKINPHFRSKYLSLEALMEQVLPILNAHGLVLIQQPGFVPNQDGDGGTTLVPTLTTTLLHANSGEKLESVMLLQAGKNDPQGQGAAITYARRQAFMAAMGLVADADDDGNRAQNRKPASTGKAAGTAAAAPASADAPQAARAASQQAAAASAPEPPPDDPQRTQTLVGIAQQIISDIQQEFGDHPDGVSWHDRMAAKVKEWFETDDLATLTTEQATKLVQRLRATRTKLVADREKNATEPTPGTDGDG